MWFYRRGKRKTRIVEACYVWKVICVYSIPWKIFPTIFIKISNAFKIPKSTNPTATWSLWVHNEIIVHRVHATMEQRATLNFLSECMWEGNGQVWLIFRYPRRHNKTGKTKGFHTGVIKPGVLHKEINFCSYGKTSKWHRLITSETKGNAKTSPYFVWDVLWGKGRGASTCSHSVSPWRPRTNKKEQTICLHTEL